MRLLPGRYVLPERYLRFIGQAVLTPNTNVSFTPHAHTTDSDIAALARRYSSYYLTQGRRLFVSGRDGVFPLEADDMQRPFIFDSNAMEVAQNTVCYAVHTHMDAQIRTRDRDRQIDRVPKSVCEGRKWKPTMQNYNASSMVYSHVIAHVFVYSFRSCVCLPGHGQSHAFILHTYTVLSIPR